MTELKRRLAAYGKPPVAIERPSGPLVDALVEAGFTVVPIHRAHRSRPVDLITTASVHTPPELITVRDASADHH